MAKKLCTFLFFTGICSLTAQEAVSEYPYIELATPDVFFYEKYLCKALSLTDPLLYRITNNKRSLKVAQYEEFLIFSESYLPYKDYTWKDADCWQLINYPSAVIQATKSNVEGFSENADILSQHWYFKALKTGAYKFVFKHYLQKMTVEIVVEGASYNELDYLLKKEPINSSLSSELKTEYDNLINRIERIPQDYYYRPEINSSLGMLTVSDMVAIAIGFSMQLMSWYEEGICGNVVPTNLPRTSFPKEYFNELMYQFIQKYQYKSRDQQLQELHNVTYRIIKIIENEYKSGNLTKIGKWKWCVRPEDKLNSLHDWIKGLVIANYRAAYKLTDSFMAENNLGYKPKIRNFKDLIHNHWHAIFHQEKKRGANIVELLDKRFALLERLRS